ncbi:MAG: hypothetical protein LC791_02770, partial [Acidobacteria bacterium]|nr:hypothetical protein [Acidobacteriota bacterium]
MTVVVVLRNTGTDPVTDIRLTSVPDPEITVAVAEPFSAVPPSSDGAATLHVSNGGVSADGKVLLRVDYTTKQESAG